ncbi:MAG TPA: gamma-glutamyl-gamma-aminobutyrate hydrolase family protein [Nitriliruptoraceae bacterium]|nr:gamma-glutamyl-gamma-aminobutyrate hydrolase family protein [Nitriliruptoraceae bacterium]
MTTWRRPLPTFVAADTDLYTLAAEYVDSVKASGGVPVLLPQVEPGDVGVVLDGVDAVVVCGGGDVDPTSYGADPLHVKDNDPAADAVELAVLAGARKRGLPTLAICRGMQLLNVAYGGDLAQDITAENTPHPPISTDADEVMGLRHDVDIVAGSRLGDVLGGGRREVNAIHHQGVGTIGSGLTVTARATDGVVEALEPADWPACIGVQWHPEKIYASDRALFDWLVTAAA